MRFFEVDSAVDAIMSAAMVAQTKASTMGKVGKLSMNGFLQMLANAGIVIDYEGFKTVFDANPQIKNVVSKFDKDTITFVGDTNDEDEGFEEPTTDMPDDERVAKMAKRAMRTREFTENKELKAKVDRLEDENQHGQVALELAQAYGTELEVNLINAINAVHSARGHIENEERQLRDSITRKYYKQMLSDMNEGKSPHKKGTAKYKKHMAAMHAGESVIEAWQAFKEGAPKMKYALVGTDMKIYSMGSDERDLRLDRRSLEKRFPDAAPLKMARLKTAQRIGDTVDSDQIKERSLTKAEKEKMKHYEKKLDKAEFKKRYGKEGEAIYYATATKMAKKNA